MLLTASDTGLLSARIAALAGCERFRVSLFEWIEGNQLFLSNSRPLLISAGYLLMLCAVTTLPLNAQATASNPYQELDELARYAKSDSDIGLLMDDILGTTMLGPVAASLRNRIVAGQISFGTGRQKSVTEDSLAQAVNGLGVSVAGSGFSGTNSLQVHLLRISMYRDLPHLLQSPAPPPPKALVGPDLTPAGGVYLCLLLIRQKLTNPAWFGDPDLQNKIWMATPSNGPVDIPGFTASSMAQAQRFTRTLENGMPIENSPVVAAFHKMLDVLGIN